MFSKLKLAALVTIFCVIQTAREVKTSRGQHDSSVLNRQILRKWLAEAPENHAPEAISDVLAELSHGPSLKTRLREDLRQKLGNIEDLPESFDARQKWKHCKHLIGAVHNQGPCKSDYAIVAASVLADRLCIQSNGKFKDMLSAQKILECYGSCKFGGFMWDTFEYLNKTGTTTGGLYQSEEGCVPFKPQPCSHRGNDRMMASDGDLPDCSTLPSREYNWCDKKCTNENYDKKFTEDIHKTAKFGWAPTNAKKLQTEIYVNGSVAAGFTMYDDFRGYESGVYNKSSNAGYEGSHKVKLIGWGIEDDGTPYWLAVNSFGKEWGLQGLFKFPRGRNYYFIESLGIKVTPQL